MIKDMFGALIALSPVMAFFAYNLGFISLPF